MEGAPLHILILPSLPYQTAYLPFAGIFQKHLAEGLIASGHRAGVLSAGLLPFAGVLKPNSYKKPALSEENGVCVVRRFEKSWMPQRYVGTEAKAGAMLRLGMEAYEAYAAAWGRPHLIHVHDCLYAGILAKVLKAKYGLPYIVTEHSTMHARGLYTAAQQELIRGVFMDASAVTAVGSGLMKELKGRYGEIEAVRNLEIVYNLLDAEFENETLQSDAGTADGDSFVFLNVAHLVEQKSQLNLVRAMPAVISQHGNAELRIGGAGPMQSQLEQEIMRLGLSAHVKLLGPLDREHVKRQMRECNAFVLSSRVETFGVVLIEAMALGKPVVATVCGGPEDFVDDVSGYLAPAGDVGALAGAMIKMAETAGSFQPERIRRHCIERFGRKAFVGRLERIYGSILG